MGTEGYRAFINDMGLVLRDVKFDESVQGNIGSWGSSALRGPQRVAGSSLAPAPVQDAVAAARRLTQRVTHADNASLAPAEDTDGSVTDNGRGCEDDAKDTEDMVADTKPAQGSGDTANAVAKTEPAPRFERLRVRF